MLLRCHAFAAQRGLRRGLGGQATLALCAALMGALTAHAGAASLRISQYQKQSWQVENGRPTGNVRAIVQTPDGMLLIASSAGMVSFDGRGIVARHANGSTVSLSYQTLWFRLLLLVPLCLLAVKLFRWRVARVKGELGVVLEERYRIARDWHDTLMAEFAAISWQLESTVSFCGKIPWEGNIGRRSHANWREAW
jgi:hypothetical protein